jgi:hypothetical protein
LVEGNNFWIMRTVILILVFFKISYLSFYFNLLYCYVNLEILEKLFFPWDWNVILILLCYSLVARLLYFELFMKTINKKMLICFFDGFMK